MSITTTVYQNNLYRVNADLLKAEGDFIFIDNLLFPNGPDWEGLNIEKFDIDNVEVEVKPYYNFATMAAQGAGKISGDFPIYVNFYSGNTVGDSVEMDFSKFILSGKYVKGSATTGVKAEFGGRYYKTVLSTAPESVSDITKQNIANKENATNTIDDYSAASDKTVLQKGRVVVCIRTSDFKVPEENYLTAPNSSKKPAGDSSSTAILRHLKGKCQVEQQPEIEGRKKGKKTPAPVTQDIFCEDSSSDGKLVLDYAFWVLSKYTITYTRKN